MNFMQAGPFFENQWACWSPVPLTVGRYCRDRFSGPAGHAVDSTGFQVVTLGALAYFARYTIWGLISLQDSTGPSVDAVGQFVWTAPLMMRYSARFYRIVHACFCFRFYVC